MVCSIACLFVLWRRVCLENENLIFSIFHFDWESERRKGMTFQQPTSFHSERQATQRHLLSIWDDSLLKQSTLQRNKIGKINGETVSCGRQWTETKMSFRWWNYYTFSAFHISNVWNTAANQHSLHSFTARFHWPVVESSKTLQTNWMMNRGDGSVDDKMVSD